MDFLFCISSMVSPQGSIKMDEEFESLPLAQEDNNECTLGRIGRHNVAIAGLLCGAQGKVAIADVVWGIRWIFNNMIVAVLTGIRGGVSHLHEGWSVSEISPSTTRSCGLLRPLLQIERVSQMALMNASFSYKSMPPPMRSPQHNFPWA